MNLLVIIGLGFGANYFQTDLHAISSFNSSAEPFNFPEDDTLRLIGIMAQFPIEVPENPKTSGNGHFLFGESEGYINFFESEIPRCEGFLVDIPPHNSPYFRKQLEAVGNYYEYVSDSNLYHTADIILNSNFPEYGYYTVSHEMEYYAKGDTLLARFFSEALDSAHSDIETYFDGKDFFPDDVVFVVFHAGLSQDFSYPSLDPTIYDLKSAYIDSIMMEDIVPTIIFKDNIPYEISNGILLPETQNIIFYNVVEDIFGNPDYGMEDLCDIQVGMTGIFSFLIGYELGLPPMFINDSTSINYGDSGVGMFGLMDQGSNNGRGVIPIPPTAWTRSLISEWAEVINIETFTSTDSILVESINASNQIYKINISEDEYFLIENRNNWVLPETDIDSLRRKNKINDSQLGHWFDVVTDTSGEFRKNNLIEIDESTGVITGFDHYDYGLPGAGILIWHIKEADEGLYSIGINNDRYNRHVQIEEADGAVDIGFESYTFFSSDNPTTGTRWDMWFKGNEAYEFGNPNSDNVIFDNWSSPNTRTTDGAESFLSIRILSEISDSMYISISLDDGIEIVNLSDEPVHYLGNGYDVFNSTAAVFYEKEELIYKHSFDSLIDTLDYLDYVEGKFIYTYEDSIGYFSGDICIHPDCVDIENEIQPMGYINLDDNDSIPVPPETLSLGDLDGDGLDEIISIENGDIFAKNSNGTLVNGFPINGDFSGVPLIANILEGSKPEIICREEADIIILSHEGEILRKLSSFDVDQPLAMVPFWNEKMALIDGSRLFLFDLDMDHSYWMNARSQPSGFPMSTGIHSPQNMAWQNAYNYPNPITEGHTTFRFFVESSTGNIQIRIYNAAGFLVKDNLELNNPLVNEFNEIPWNNIQVDAGLYLAEIKRDVGKSELVRIVVIK